MIGNQRGQPSDWFRAKTLVFDFTIMMRRKSGGRSGQATMHFRRALRSPADNFPSARESITPSGNPSEAPCTEANEQGWHRWQNSDSRRLAKVGSCKRKAVVPSSERERREVSYGSAVHSEVRISEREQIRL